MIFQNLSWIVAFFVSGLTVGGFTGWEINNWRHHSNELAQRSLDYTNLVNEFAKFEADSQKIVSDFNAKITIFISNIQEIEQKKDAIIQKKETDITGIHEKMRALQQSITALHSITCNLDAEHQQLLDDLSKTANHQSASDASASGKRAVPKNTNQSHPNVPQLKQ